MQHISLFGRSTFFVFLGSLNNLLSTILTSITGYNRSVFLVFRKSVKLADLFFFLFCSLWKRYGNNWKHLKDYLPHSCSAILDSCTDLLKVCWTFWKFSFKLTFDNFVWTLVPIRGWLSVLGWSIKSSLLCASEVQLLM